MQGKAYVVEKEDNDTAKSLLHKPYHVKGLIRNSNVEVIQITTTKPMLIYSIPSNCNYLMIRLYLKLKPLNGLKFQIKTVFFQ